MDTPQPVPTERMVPPVVLRSWPKIVMMLPTFLLSIFCGAIMSMYGMPEPKESFGWVHFVNLVFLLILAINLMLLLYDLNLRSFLIVILSLVAIVLVLYILDLQKGGVWEALKHAFSICVLANSAFYFLFAIILGINLLIAWIITRFHYWVVDHNEIIIHTGFMHEQERHPTNTARFTLEIDDIVEYGLFGSGKLVFTFSDDKKEHELPTVLRVRKKAQQLDLLLGRLAVTQE